MNRFFFLYACLCTAITSYADNFVSISGKVTDYDNQPIDSCWVSISDANFSSIYETLTDSLGFYHFDSVTVGKYAALLAVRQKEYPRMLKVPEKDMRLEFWAWNLIADRDINLNIRYDKLELYGTKAFFEYGGRPELLIYTRPMSITKYIACENYADKADADKNAPTITVAPQFINFEIYCDGQPLEIYSIQPISLPTKDRLNNENDTCYIIQAQIPDDLQNHVGSPYEIRVVAHNTEYDEWGENVYYLESLDYARKNSRE